MTPPTEAPEVSDAAFLRDLAGRLFRLATPAQGFDQGGADRLYRISRDLTSASPMKSVVEAAALRIQAAYQASHADTFLPIETCRIYALAALNQSASQSPPEQAVQGDAVRERVLAKWEKIRADLNRYHAEGAITYGELKHGVNMAALMRDAALGADEDEALATPPAPVEGVRTAAAANIVDRMMGGHTAWRHRLDDSDFLESADWATALEYADAALRATASPAPEDNLLRGEGVS